MADLKDEGIIYPEELKRKEFHESPYEGGELFNRFKIILAKSFNKPLKYIDDLIKDGRFKIIVRNDYKTPHVYGYEGFQFAIEVNGEFIPLLHFKIKMSELRKLGIDFNPPVEALKGIMVDCSPESIESFENELKKKFEDLNSKDSIFFKWLISEDVATFGSEVRNIAIKNPNVQNLVKKATMRDSDFGADSDEKLNAAFNELISKDKIQFLVISTNDQTDTDMNTPMGHQYTFKGIYPESFIKGGHQNVKIVAKIEGEEVILGFGMIFTFFHQALGIGGKEGFNLMTDDPSPKWEDNSRNTTIKVAENQMMRFLITRTL